MSNQARSIKRRARREAEQPKEIMGLDHPKMTPQLAAKILPHGPRVPVPLLHRLGQLCNPMTYRALPNGELMALADEVNALLDRQLREAQKPD
jgi:hypothetical protein